MTGDFGWREAAGFGWKVGVAVGGAIGFQEGFLAATTKSGASTQIPLTNAVQLVQVYFTPVFAEMVLWGVVGFVGALLMRLVFGRLFRFCRTADGFIPFFSGLLAATANIIFIFFIINGSISLAALFDPPKLLFNTRLVFSGVLLGMAVGFIVRAVRKRPRAHLYKAWSVAPVIWLLLSTPLVLWANRVHFKLNFTPAFFGALLFFMLALALLVWLTAAWLAPRYLKGVSRYPLARHLPTLVLLLVAVPVFLAPYIGISGREGPGDGAGRGELDRNAIIISVDTLRADRLSSAGSTQVSTPNIDRLAEEGVLFTRAQATSSWTLSSLCSMLTSLYPTAHGVLSMLDQMDVSRETLAEAAAAGGYHTAAVISNGWLLDPFGASQGFAFYDHMKHRVRASYWAGNLWYRVFSRLRAVVAPVEADVADDTTDAALNLRYALEFLEANRDSNFFLWLHVIDPHEPYVARDRWIADAGRDYKGNQLPRLNSGMVVHYRGGKVLDQADRRHIEDLYNREVEYTDMIIGRFLDRVYEMGLTRNTMIIFTSDHGEEFWEHDNLSHGHTCYDELVHVPLIIRPADEEDVERGRRIEAHAGLIDLAPTVLDYFGLPGLENAAGRSLLPAIRGAEELEQRPAFFEAMAYFGEKKSVSDGRYKFVMDEVTGREELYDLVEDPGEQRNLADDLPQVRLELKGLLMDHLSSQRRLAEDLGVSGEQAEIGADTRAHLQALGYLH